MRITKRQLKRIIREEYSRLKRRGLIRENKDQVLEMINDLEKGDDLGMILDFSYLKELVSNGDLEGALEEIGYMKYDTETAGDDELLQELERLIRGSLGSLSNHPMNAQLGGKIGNRSGGTIDQQVRELVNAHYSLDQGWDQEEIDDANETVQRLQSEMSPADFEKATKIAELCVYYNEYATRADVDQTVEEIEAACAQLGLTADDVI